ncbi:MAG: hypothetical protein HRT47_10805 [Candidatus Caenarcaniphilales bacterium]|nr:hypothetical protein [Candidatus Caenarcaniphilales bacterium]
MNLGSLFLFDTLAITISALVAIVAVIVVQYAKNYLHGDQKQGAFYIKLGALLSFTWLMLLSNNILVFIGFFFLSNYFLSQLMVHKKVWGAAKEAGGMALGYFSLGAVALLAFAGICYYSLETFTITEIVQGLGTMPKNLSILAFVSLLIAALAQCSQIPFHKWLLSSMNSPTPVSALMHAGLVNGGGFLLVRFNPLISSDTGFMTTVFFAGIISAFIASLWSFTQNTVKAKLVCSTISQMGFMIAQVGLGLFSAAISHLCMHGFFKAFHFLAAGSTLTKEYIKKVPLSLKSKIFRFAFSLVTAYFALQIFVSQSHIALEWFSSSSILLLFVFMSLAQVAYTVSLHLRSSFVFAMALFSSFAVAFLYGNMIHLFELLLKQDVQDYVYQITVWQYFALLPFVGIWTAMNFKQNLIEALPEKLQFKAYSMIHSSSLSPVEVNTVNRFDYNYKEAK